VNGDIRRVDGWKMCGRRQRALGSSESWRGLSGWRVDVMTVLCDGEVSVHGDCWKCVYTNERKGNENVHKQNKTYYTTKDTKRCVMSAQWHKLCSAWCFRKQSVSTLPV